MLFTGHAEVVIDPKSRLAIPAKYRALWDPSRDGAFWYLVPWTNNVLRLYTQARFDQLAERGEQSLLPDADEAALETDFYSLVERVEPDSAGRITIPKWHLEKTGLSSEVVVVGARNRLEVHDRKRWNATLDERFANLPSLVARLGPRSARGGG